MTNSLLMVFAFTALFNAGCYAQKNKQSASSEPKAILPKGELELAQNFTGKAWAYSLVVNNSTNNTLVGNVPARALALLAE